MAQFWLGFDAFRFSLVDGLVFWFRSNFGTHLDGSKIRERMDSNQKLKGMTNKMKGYKLRDSLSLSWIFYQINLEKSDRRIQPFFTINYKRMVLCIKNQKKRLLNEVFKTATFTQVDIQSDFLVPYSHISIKLNHLFKRKIIEAIDSLLLIDKLRKVCKLILAR